MNAGAFLFTVKTGLGLTKTMFKFMIRVDVRLFLFGDGFQPNGREILSELKENSTKKNILIFWRMFYFHQLGPGFRIGQSGLFKTDHLSTRQESSVHGLTNTQK